jgi:hypothetical protein
MVESSEAARDNLKIAHLILEQRVVVRLLRQVPDVKVTLMLQAEQSRA